MTSMLSSTGLALTQNAGADAELASLYESRARAVPYPTEAAQMLCKAARIAHDSLGDTPRAEILFRRALNYLPTSREALAGLKAIFDSRGDEERRADILEKLGDASNGQEAADFYFEAGEILEKRLGKYARALLLYNSARKASPTERRAYRSARQLLIANGRFSGAYATLELERVKFGDIDLGSAYLEFAEQLVGFPAYHLYARQALKRVTDGDASNPRAQAILTELNGLQVRWMDKVAQLQTQAAAESDAHTAARLHFNIALLYFQYAPTAIDAMKKALDRALALWPAMPDVLDLFQQFATRAGDVRIAAGLFKKLAADATDPVARGNILLRLGRLEMATNPKSAAATFEDAATAFPTRADVGTLAAEAMIARGKPVEALKILAVLSERRSPAQIGAQWMAGEVCHTVLGDGGAAIEHLRRAAELDSDNTAAAARLVSLFLADKKLDELWPYLDAAVRANRPASQRAAMCEEIAALCLNNDDYPRATHALSLALAVDPKRPNLLPALLKISRIAKLELEVAAVLRTAYQAADPAGQLVLARALGGLLEKAGRFTEAQEAWNDVLRLSPNDPAATTALAAINAAIAAATPSTPLDQALAHVARLEGAGADPTELAQAHRAVLALDSESVPTLKRLGALGTQLGNWQEVGSVVERLLALTTSREERRDWKQRLAQLYAERLDRKDEAAQLYLNLVEEGVESGAVLAALERLASLGIRRAEIGRTLAPLYEKAGDFQRQVASLLVQLASATDPTEVRGLLNGLAETSELRLHDLRAAFDYRLRALAILPLDAAARSHAARLARAVNSERELSNVLRDEAQKVGPPASILMLQEAAALASEVGAFEDATNALKAAQKQDPQDRSVLTQLVGIARRAERDSDLELALRALAATSTGPDRTALWLELEVLNEKLSRPKEAAAALAEAVRCGAPEGEHLPRLAKRLEATQQWDEMLVVLERLKGLYETSGDAAHLARLLDQKRLVTEVALGGRGEALRRYASILEQKPNDQEASEALEEMLGDPSHREQAAAGLLKAYEAVGDIRKQAMALSIVGEAAQDVPDRVRALKRLAKLYASNLRQPEKSLQALSDALRLAPDDAEALASAQAVSEDGGIVDAYARVLEDLVHAPHAPERLLREELAALYERKLNQPDDAIRHLRSLLEIDPKHLESLKSLLRLYRTREDWPSLVEVIERVVPMESTATTRIQLLAEAATVCEQRLNSPKEAATFWRQVATAQPGSREAALALERLYSKLDLPHDLAFALELRRHQEVQGPQSRDIATRLAVVRKTRLDDARGALELFRQVLAEDPGHQGARAALNAWVVSGASEGALAADILDAAYADTKDASSRVTLREALLHHPASPDDRYRINREIRGLMEHDLKQPDAAFMNALRCFVMGDNRSGLRPELVRLASATNALPEVAEVYEATAEDEAVARDERMALFSDAAVLRTQLGQPDFASKDWDAVLALAPDDATALAGLSKLYEQSNNAKSLAQVYARQAELAPDADERRALLLKAAAAHENSGGDDDAIALYRAALDGGSTAEPLQALVKIYARLKRTDDLLETLASLAARPDEASVRATYQTQRGSIFDRLGRLTEAVTAYESALTLAPQHPGALAGLERLVQISDVQASAAKVLEPIYRSLGDTKKLADLLEIRVGDLTGTPHLTMLAEVAQLRERSGQLPQAFATWARCFAVAPTESRVRTELERLAETTGAIPELAASYEEALARGLEPELEVEIWRRLGALYADKLARLDSAATAWNEVLKRAPDDRAALERLGDVFQKTSQFREYATVLRRRLAVERDGETQRTILTELAALADEVLSDKALAVQCYQALLERTPDSEPTFRNVARLLAQMERWSELVDALDADARRAAAHGQTAYALEQKVRAGRVRLVRLEDSQAALDAFSSVLEQDPSHAAAIGALEEMARSSDPLKAEAAKLLDPIFSRGGEYLKQAQMLEARADAESSPRGRADLFLKVAELYDKELSNPELAFATAARALDEVPGDDRILTSLALLAARTEMQNELVEVLARTAPRAAGSKERVASYKLLARAVAMDPPASADAWRAVLASAPDDREALLALADNLEKQGAYSELISVIGHDQQLEADPVRKVDLLRRMGTIQAQSLNDVPGALDSFRQALRILPDDVAALEASAALAERLDDWSEASEFLAQLAKIAATPERRNAYLMRLGLVREGKLGDVPGAVRCYEDILSVDAHHEPSISRLEEMVRVEPRNAAAAQGLYKAYVAAGDRLRLIPLLQGQIEVAEAGPPRHALLLSLARLREANGEADQAFLAYYRAFQEEPNDRPTREKLIETGIATHVVEDLVDTLVGDFGQISEPEEAADAAMAIGGLYEQHLRNDEKAVEYYERARGEASQLVSALGGLIRLYRKHGAYPQLAGALEDLARHLPPSKQSAALWLELAKVAREQLSDADRSVEALEQVIAAEPDNLVALKSLAELYERNADHEKLADALAKAAAVAKGPEAEALNVKRINALAAIPGRREEAIELARDVLTKNPKSASAFDTVAALYEEAGRHGELEQLIVTRLASTTDQATLVRLNSELGNLRLNHLDKAEDAIGPYRTVLQRDPQNLRAPGALRTAFRKLGKREDLMLILRRMLPLPLPEPEARSVRIEIAELLADSRRREEALEFGRKVLDLNPDVEDLDRVQAIFLKLSAFPEAARAMEAKLAVQQGASDLAGAARTALELAEMWESGAKNPANAGKAYELLLELDPTNRVAYERAKTVRAAAGDWRAYADLVERFLPNLETDAERGASLADLANVYETKLNEKDAAFLFSLRALEISPGDESLRVQSQALAAQTNSFEELAAAYEQVVENVPRGPAAEEIYLALASIQESKLNNAKAAEGSIRSILAFNPTSARAQEALAKLLGAHGDGESYVAALQARLKNTDDPASRVAVLREIALAQEERLGDYPGAVASLQAALDASPDFATAQALAKLHQKHQNLPKFAAALRQSAGLAATPPERAQFYIEAANVFEEAGDSDAAADSYASAVQETPTDVEALVEVERLYLKLNRFTDLLNAYAMHVEVAPTVAQRVNLHFMSADIWESKFDNLENAEQSVVAAIAIDPKNLVAYERLERLLRAQSKWDALVTTLNHHAELVFAPTELALLYTAIGDVEGQHRRASDRAVAAYQRAIDADPHSIAALSAIAGLYERSGNWPQALEAMEKAAALVPNSIEALDLHVRMGKLYEEILSDNVSAKRSYGNALAIMSGHIASLQGLQRIYEAEGDFANYEKVLLDVARYSPDAPSQAKGWLQYGKYLESKDDLEGAVQAFESAYRAHPESSEVALALADMYYRTERWQQSEEILEKVVDGIDDQVRANPSEAAALNQLRAERLYRLGNAAQKNGHEAKALQSYEAALEIDPTYLPALELYANLLEKLGRIEGAYRVCGTIRTHHRRSLSELEVSELYWTMGNLARQLGDANRAVSHFEEALELSKSHEPSLRSLVEIHADAGRFPKALEYGARMLRAASPESRYDVGIAIGSMARDQVGDLHLAIEGYLLAHRANPESADVLETLWMLYRDTKQGTKAAEFLERELLLPAVQADPERSKRGYLQLGELYRDTSHDIGRASESFNRALDIDYRDIEAFAALEGMLGEAQDWRGLEDNYKRMIARLPKTEETHVARMALWQSLGDLYANAMQAPEAAYEAYKVAAAGLPQSGDAQAKFATVAQSLPNHEAEAITAWRRAVGTSADPSVAVSALAQLGAKVKDYDLAWLAAQVANGFLGQTDEGEREILTKLEPFAKKKETAARPLSAELWVARLYHPNIRGPLGNLLAILYDATRAHFKDEFTKYGIIPKKHLIDVARAQEFQMNQYRSAARLLGMDAVPVYSPFLATTRDRAGKKSPEPAPDPMVLIDITHTDPPAIRLGGRYFSETGTSELGYITGRALTYFRPELALTARLSSERLNALVQAAISLCVERFHFTANPQAIEADRVVLNRLLTPQAKEALVRVTRDYVASSTSVNLAPFLEGAEFTASRAGTLCAGNFESVKHMVMGEVGAAYFTQPAAKIRDLASFVLSLDYQSIRSAIGTNVEVKVARR